VRQILFAMVSMLAFSPAYAHEQWADGSAIPAWIKAACCGPADAHQLRPDQVHRLDNGDWQIDGLARPVANEAAIPSQDGQYWAFYRGPYCISGDMKCSDSQSVIYCFFVPMSF